MDPRTIGAAPLSVALALLDQNNSTEDKNQ